jgi:hypothetical protein
MPAFEYDATESPDYIKEAPPEAFHPGFVASFRIGRLAVVKDEEGQTHKEKLEKLRGCGIRVDVTEM